MTTYIGGAEAKTPDWISGYINIKNPQDYINANGELKIKININTRKSVGKYGETHSISVNEWKPNNDDRPQATQSVEEPDEFDRALDRKKRTDQERADIILDDIPF